MTEDSTGLKRTSQATLIRTLEILCLLDHTFGKSVDELHQYFIDTEGEKTAPSKRSIYRYIQTLEAAGFFIEKNDNRFKITSKHPSLDISNILQFVQDKTPHTEGDNTGEDSEYKHKLAQKLFSLYDFDKVARTLVKNEDTENILYLISAIKNENQVILKNYRSANSKTIRDRLVEPVGFSYRYDAFWAFDTEDKKNKQFITSRVSKVEIRNAGFKYKSFHKKGETDAFRISGPRAIEVQLKLTLRACNLLLEEYPAAESDIEMLSTGEYLLTTKVYGFEGVGRFVMGLPGDVRIIIPNSLKEYVVEKIKGLVL